MDFSRLRHLPNWLLGGGGGVVLLGLLLCLRDLRPLGYAWLLAFMMCLSLTLGALFLVIVHHLFDAGWSVPIRRFCEHLACLSAPVMFVLWLPIGFLAPKLYPWMGPVLQAHPDHALHAKYPLFTIPGFYVVSLACFAVWFVVSRGLRRWSLRQDESGAAECTYAMRRWAAVGIFLFAVSVTFAVIFWMKALSHLWFSTMYGVYYFAGSVWVTLATVYVITLWLEQQGALRGKLHEHQYYFIGSLFFAFTVFYAYIAFSQYFIIWNANVPEETFWYLLREKGTWLTLGIVMIFGHFFLPFLALLRIDAKHYFPLMLGLYAWAWVMHFADMAFNILPVPHPEGFPFQWLWLYLGCIAFMAGLLMKLFVRDLQRYPAYPLRDPRLLEALGHRPAASPISGGELPETDDLEEQIEGPVGSKPETTGGGK